MSSILRAAAVSLTLATFSITGACFGGGSDALSLEDYFDELQQLDNEFSEKQDALDKEYSDSLSGEFSEDVVDDFAAYFGETRSAADSFVGELEQLDPPEEAADAHEDAVNTFNTCIEETEGVSEQIAAAETEEQVSEILMDSTGSCEDTTQSCEELQLIADENAIDVTLSCGE